MRKLTDEEINGLREDAKNKFSNFTTEEKKALQVVFSSFDQVDPAQAFWSTNLDIDAYEKLKKLLLFLY